VQFPDIIFFAIVAVFLILRLRSVLGRRTGNERERPDPFHPSPNAPDRLGAPTRPGPMGPAGGGANLPKPGDATGVAPEKVIPLPNRGADAAPSPAAKAPPLEAGLAQVGVADPNFTPQGFLDGAKVAFETTVDAFAKGDRKTLRPLLSDAVFEQFADAIHARETASKRHETTLVGVKELTLLEARMEARTAFITVKFVSEQVNVTRDKDNKVTDGDPNQVVEVTDIWVFARNTRSSNPNWTLVETRSAH
jgi:predicted lipid-binding transport protein (Tim44 family)